MLKLDIKVGESIAIGDVILRLEKKSGQLARVAIDHSPSVTVKRLNPQAQVPVMES